MSQNPDVSQTFPAGQGELPAERRLMLVVGEASGDLLGAELVRALRAQGHRFSLMGLGGPLLRAEGMSSVAPAEALAVTGLVEVLWMLPRLVRTFYRLVQQARRFRPHAIVLIDAPDLNLRLAGWLKTLNIPIVYYVSPQIWAWRPERIHRIKAVVAHVLVLFGFERVLYEAAGIPVTWVGHPVLDRYQDMLTKSIFKDTLENTFQSISENALSCPSADPLIALLPGSRRNEVLRILPALIRAARHLLLQHPNARFRLIQAPSVPDAWLEAAQGSGLPLECVKVPVLQGLQGVQAAWVASGTATLETAVVGVPMVIVYALSPLSHWLGRRLFRLPWIGLPNILLNQGVVPECIQDLTPERLCEPLLQVLSSQEKWQAQHEALLQVRGLLGEGRAAEKAATAVGAMLVGAML